MPAYSDPVLLRLCGWNLLEIQGADAGTFLHGQFTNDLESLPDDQAQFSAYCLPKGQTIACFLIWRETADHYRMLLPTEVCERVTKRLLMFRLQADVEVQDVTNDWVFFGQYGEPPLLSSIQYEQPLPLIRALECTILRWPGTQQRWVTLQNTKANPVPIHLIDPSQRDLIHSKLCPPAKDPNFVPRDTELNWQRWDIEDGLSFLRGASCEQFVPQHINLDLLDAISFSKGCYPGQEVVARMHYRGRIKHRVYRFSSDAADLEAGAEVWPAGDSRPCGHIVSTWSDTNGGSQALACLRIADAERELHAHSADGTALTPLPLPYALIEPTEE